MAFGIERGFPHQGSRRKYGTSGRGADKAHAPLQHAPRLGHIRRCAACGIKRPHPGDARIRFFASAHLAPVLFGIGAHRSAASPSVNGLAIKADAFHDGKRLGPLLFSPPEEVLPASANSAITGQGQRQTAPPHPELATNIEEIRIDRARKTSAAGKSVGEDQPAGI